MNSRFVYKLCVITACGLVLGTVAYGMVDEHYINTRIAHEVRRQQGMGGAGDADLAPCKPVCRPEPVCGLYSLPHWPTYSLFFEKGDLINVSVDMKWATQAYGPHGKTCDYSTLMFGADPITVGTLLLPPRLLAANKVELPCVLAGAFCPPNAAVPGLIDDQGRLLKEAYYLYFLKDQAFRLDASQDDYQFSIDYARSFRCGSVTVGVHLPVILRHHRIKLANGLSEANLNKIKQVESLVNANQNLFVDSTGHVNHSLTKLINFFENYNTFEDFFVDILHRKGMTFNQEGTRLGVSDMQVYVNVRLKSRCWERGLFGVMLQLPTARDRDNNQLWPTEFGNGGFVELSAYSSFYWQCYRFFNPYVHARATYSFDATINRRVPRYISHDGSKAGQKADCALDILFGENILLKSAAQNGTFSELDTLTKGFADKVARVKMHRGPEFFARLGMQWGPFFSCHGALDWYYDLHIKGKDYAGKRKLDDIYKPSNITGGTWSSSHKFGGAYSHQFDDSYRFGIGASYVFAGQNAAKEFGLDMFLNVEF